MSGSTSIVGNTYITVGRPTGYSSSVTTGGGLDVSGVAYIYNGTQDTTLAVNCGNGQFATIEAFNAGNTTKRNISLSPYGGNVGIGTTNPGTTLDLNAGSFRFGGYKMVFGSFTNNATSGSSYIGSATISGLSSIAYITLTAVGENGPYTYVATVRKITNNTVNYYLIQFQSSATGFYTGDGMPIHYVAFGTPA